jgi:hypothetical protein
MVYYRIYSLDLIGRHFIDVHHFEADGDADAISKVGHGSWGYLESFGISGEKSWISRSESSVSAGVREVRA